MNDILISYGYWGMAIAAFLAGTFVPFSSEVVMGALLASTTMNSTLVVAFGTVGNVLGTMVNYALGRLASPQTIARWLHVKPRRMERTQRWAERYGAWLAFITFLPALGTAIAVALGTLRANVTAVVLTATAGKLLRYILVAATVAALK